MSDRYFYLDQLSPTEALHLLAEAVPKIEAKQLEHLKEVSLLIKSSILGQEVSFVMPDPRASSRWRRNKAREQAFDTLINIYQSIKNSQPRIDHFFEKTISFTEGVTQLLTHSGQSQELAQESQQEYLLVGRHIEKERAAELFEDLRFHATHTYMGIAETDAGTRYLFHVRDDHDRRSSFLSLQGADFFPEGNILSGFSSHDSLLFLPQDIKPGRRALTYFCRLLQAAPTLFGLNSNSAPSEAASHRLLVAIDRLPAQKHLNGQKNTNQEPTDQKRATFELLYLAQLAFYSQIQVGPPAYEYADFEILDLKASEKALSELRDAIEEAEPYVGYRLELRRTKVREPIEVERKRLLDQQIELEYKLAYLNSISQPRPMLLRFTEKQLPALADVIRSFPGKVVRNGKIKYGFQSTQNHPSGLHFLYIEPQHAGTNELDPLLMWDDLDNRPMRFWLDPFWARYYHHKGNQCLIFVPERTALFPGMHDWDVGSMDRYMRTIMGQWFHGRYGVGSIPAKPIYIFDGEPHPTEKIHISVLDFANFRPLHTKLGWINQHLEIIDNVGLDQFISEMADHTARKELADHISQQANAAEAAFEQAAQHTSKAIAAKISKLTDALSEEIDTFIKQSEEHTEKMKELNKRLQKLKALHKEMTKHSDKTHDLIKKTKEDEQTATDASLKLKEEVDSTLKKAKEVRDDAIERMEKEIYKQQRTRDELRRKLREGR